MNQWDSYMNDPFLNASNHGDGIERVDNNAPPMAPMPTAMPTGAMPTGVMPMAYYPPIVPHGYWCPPVMPPAPLVSPVHLDDSPDGFDSPDSSDMMPPAPPLHLGAVPNVAPASVWPMGEKENEPPLGGGAAPYMGAELPGADMAPEAVPGALPGVTPGVLPGAVSSPAPYAPMYYPPVASMPYAPVAPYGYYAAPQPPYYGGTVPYAPGFPMPYGPYR